MSDAAAQRVGESAWLRLAPGGRFDFVRRSIAALNVETSNYHEKNWSKILHARFWEISANFSIVLTTQDNSF